MELLKINKIYLKFALIDIKKMNVSDNRDARKVWDRVYFQNAI